MSSKSITYIKPKARVYNYLPYMLEDYKSTSLTSDDGRFSVTCTIMCNQDHPFAIENGHMLIETHDHRNGRSDKKWQLKTLYDGLPTKEAYEAHFIGRIVRQTDWLNARKYADTAFNLVSFSEIMQERFNAYKIDPLNITTYPTWEKWSFNTGDEETEYQGFNPVYFRHYGQSGSWNDFSGEEQEDFDALHKFLVTDDMPTVHGDSETGYRVTWGAKTWNNVTTLTITNPNVKL